MQKPSIDKKRAEKLKAFDRILTIMDELRLNCPWDKKQTIESIRHLTIEEVYELSSAIIEGDLEEIKNEIGDIFLHLIFYSKIASEKNEFDISDVINHLAEKMIRRHPHIYGDLSLENEEQVKQNWEKIKLLEGSKKNKSVLEGVPSSLPALIKAYRIQEKVKGVGFEWDNKEDVWNKVEEEIEEFKTAPSPEEREKEFGDILFSLINYARFEGIDPEVALEKTNLKFQKRFIEMENQIRNENKNITEMPLTEMDVYWEKAKQKLER